MKFSSPLPDILVDRAPSIIAFDKIAEFGVIDIVGASALLNIPFSLINNPPIEPLLTIILFAVKFPLVSHEIFPSDKYPEPFILKIELAKPLS